MTFLMFVTAPIAIAALVLWHAARERAHRKRLFKGLADLVVEIFGARHRK